MVISYIAPEAVVPQYTMPYLHSGAAFLPLKIKG